MSEKLSWRCHNALIGVGVMIVFNCFPCKERRFHLKDTSANAFSSSCVCSVYMYHSMSDILRSEL